MLWTARERRSEGLPKIVVSMYHQAGLRMGKKSPLSPTAREPLKYIRWTVLGGISNELLSRANITASQIGAREETSLFTPARWGTIFKSLQLILMPRETYS